MAGRSWTQAEDLLLTRLWDSDLTVDELLPSFEARTFNAIRVRAKRLKLKHTTAQFSAVLSKNTSGERNGMFGKPGVNAGKTLSETHKERLRISALEGYASGKRIGLSGASNPRYGKPGTMLGKHLSEKSREILSLKAYERWAFRRDKTEHLLLMRQGWVKWNTRKEPTKIELLVQSWLSALEVSFEPQVVLDLFIVDFLVGSKVIETHGDYWHANPIKYDTSNLDRTQRNNVRRDHSKVVRLNKLGYSLLVLWENDLKRHPEESLCKLEEFLRE